MTTSRDCETLPTGSGTPFVAFPCSASRQGDVALSCVELGTVVRAHSSTSTTYNRCLGMWFYSIHDIRVRDASTKTYDAVARRGYLSYGPAGGRVGTRIRRAKRMNFHKHINLRPLDRATRPRPDADHSRRRGGGADAPAEDHPIMWKHVWTGAAPRLRTRARRGGFVPY